MGMGTGCSSSSLLKSGGGYQKGGRCHDGGIRMTRLWFATIACVMSLGLIVQAETAQAGLDDLLYEKGQITKEEWLKLQAEREKAAPVQGAQAPSSAALGPDPVTNLDQRLGMVEEWKAKIERLPSLGGKFNIGLNALQFLYTHQNADTAEGKSQDNLSVRRSEVLMYGKVNEYIPKWHTLMEMQSNNLTNNTPGCTAGLNCSTQVAPGTPASTTMFREAYIDFRPMPSIAPNLNVVRMGVFRMPFGIFTEQSGGLRDVISSPYLNSVGSGTVTRNGTGNSTVGTIDFIQEREYSAD